KTRKWVATRTPAKSHVCTTVERTGRPRLALGILATRAPSPEWSPPSSDHHPLCTIQSRRHCAGILELLQSRRGERRPVSVQFKSELGLDLRSSVSLLPD